MSSDDHSPLVPGSNAIPRGHSCLPAEIKRCIDAKLPLPDKIYIQIDGASDNAGHRWSPIIEVWRLPVGHTHEDIDGRFGVLSMFIREQSIETPQKF
jgi:hypothetical protein